MFGTRKEISKKLKRAFARDEKMAVLVWTLLDVQAVENMTEEEAEAILCSIGNVGMGDHIEEGISESTVKEMLAGLRADISVVEVPSDVLARIVDTAERVLKSDAACAWTLARHNFPGVGDALADIDWIKKRLAA